MAHPKHEQVRRRYAYRCGYCVVSEVDAGGDLTVDHYVPVARGGRDDDGNLVYASWRAAARRPPSKSQKMPLMHA